MGLRDRLPTIGYADVQASTPAVPAGAGSSSFPSSGGTAGVSSPWVSQSLERIVFEDVFGDLDPDAAILNSRAAALRIPAVLRARNLLCTAAARAVLVQLRGQDQTPVAPAPSWITAATDGSSPQLRMVWTTDDLIFYGASCWWRSNGADGFPLAVGRLAYGEWSINPDNRIEVDGVPQADDAVILIPGWHEGILCHGRDTIRDARNLLTVVRSRVLNPAPQLELHQTGGVQLTETERADLVEGWAAARQGLNGGVAYTSRDIETKELGSGGDAQLMIEARNASAVDLARTVGVAAGLIDATAPKASLNYETTALRNQEFIDRDLAGYLDPITARLSLDDVSPPGTRVASDLTDLQTATPSPTGPATAD